MIGGRRLLTIVPARGGSKGVPLKNMRTVLGVPLVARAWQVIREMDIIDRAVVSTDHPEIARIAREAGLDAPFARPPELSGDRVGDWEVLVHALGEVERLDRVTYDIVVMLQPTSPMRRPEHVHAAVEKLVREGWDAVWTVSRTDPKYHPLKQFRIVDGQVEYYDPRGSAVVVRQELEPLYHRNGVAYVLTRECLLEQKTIKGRRTGALVIDEEMISIDTRWDFELVEFLLGRRGSS